MKFLLLGLFLFGCEPAKVEILEVPIEIPAEIQPLPDPRPSGPNFVNLDTLEDSILFDLQNQTSLNDRQDSRYLVGCNRYNQGEDLGSFEQGVNKGINLLSTERRLQKSAPVGAGNCVYRISLSDYGITTAEWARLERCLLLPLRVNTVRNANIRFLTGARIPWLYAEDFFTFTAAGDAIASTDPQCANTYYDLKESPPALKDFLATRGINLQREFDNESVVAAGFSQSGIALGKSRGVFFVESREGWCMATQDTKLGGDDIFSNPFSIEMSIAGNGVPKTNKIFSIDANEWICANANSMYGDFRLNGAAGITEVFAPNDVVVNQQFAQFDPTIRMVDCTGCHHASQAAIAINDQLLDHIINRAGFDTEEKLLARIFFNNIKAQGIISEINQGNQQALQSLGVTDSEDPLNTAIVRPFRIEMDSKQVASFFLMEEDEFLTRLAGTQVSAQTFGNLLNGGRVSLAILSQGFLQLAQEIQAYEDINL